MLETYFLGTEAGWESPARSGPDTGGTQKLTERGTRVVEHYISDSQDGRVNAVRRACSLIAKLALHVGENV